MRVKLQDRHSSDSFSFDLYRKVRRWFGHEGKWFRGDWIKKEEGGNQINYKLFIIK